MAKIWVFAELAEGKVAPISLELLAKARDLGGEVEAVALGKGATAAAETLGKHGAKKVHAGDDEVFDQYIAQPATDTMEALLAAVPSRTHRGDRLATIPGRVPSLSALPPGCTFADRCPHAQDVCRRGELRYLSVEGRRVRCTMHDPLSGFDREAQPARLVGSETAA